VAIIIGGSQGSREYLQRVGIVLRTSEGKQAVVDDLVLRGPFEVPRADEHRRALASIDSVYQPRTELRQWRSAGASEGGVVSKEDRTGRCAGCNREAGGLAIGFSWKSRNGLQQKQTAEPLGQACDKM
jgi:superfamily II DNA or RNA helicase